MFESSDAASALHLADVGFSQCVYVQLEWSVDDVSRFIDQTCRSKFGNEKCEHYKRVIYENDVDGEVSGSGSLCWLAERPGPYL